MNDPARTDRQLYESVSTGDLRALAELAGRHARGLYDFALRGTLDEQQAASVLEAVFQRIQEPGAEVPSQIDFPTWLYSLCLVEVLAVSNETRTARISTDDERFFQLTTDVDVDVAHWAWQAARGLRTRDYCVLDLTLRRGLTPEEVAEAASLTRSNLYASIGRARGAFEETFAAMLLFEYGRDACPELEEMVEGAPGTGLRPALRHQIIEHADDCDACRHTLDALPPAANVYLSLADIEMPEALTRRILGDATPLLVETPASSDALPAFTATSAAFAAGAAALDVDPQPDSLELEPDELHAPDITDDVVDDVDTAVDAEDEDVFGEEADFEDDETSEDESEFETEGATVAVAPLTAPLAGRGPEAVPVTPIQREEPPYERRGGFGVASAVGVLRSQPLMWTYALMGIAAVIAIYLGIAVADSLQSGGGDSGAMPLDTQPGVSASREIDCGDEPVEMDAGAATVISFDEGALDGYKIKTLSFAPDSDFAEFGDLEATLEDPYSIRFVAKKQETAEIRTEQFQLQIQWERGEELASSTCQLLVHIAP